MLQTEKSAHFFSNSLAYSALASVLLILTCISAGKNSSKKQLGTEISTENGKVLGAEFENNTWVWKGIPYAKPPVGELRWKEPQDPELWEGIKETKEFCDVCAQYDGSFSGKQNIIGNEDCLYLNVWRPATQERNLPVYFWMHGGGNSMGSGRTDARYIAGNSNMVVVTVQHRLGPFGWFAHPAFRHGKNLSDDSGNFGTLDIIQALKWVKKNIATFGGNPDNVMIVGESSGGKNVFSMLLSPLAKGLFHKAISQSGNISNDTIPAAEEESKKAVDALLKADGLEKTPGDDIEAYLRRKSFKEILDVYTPGGGGMLSLQDIFADGYVLPADLRGALANPETYNQVPAIIGANRDETKLFRLGLYNSWDPAKYDGLSFDEYNVKISREWIIREVDTPVMAMVSHKSQPPVYVYQLNYGAYNENGYNAWNSTNSAIMLGACHALDIPLFWNDYSSYPMFRGIFREDNRTGYESLSRAMMAFVDRFARTGNPGKAGSIEWKPWSNTDGDAKRILFDANNDEALIKMSNE